LAVSAAGGALVAFVLSRIVGLFGFSERGWVPSPRAAISVGAEVLTILLGRTVSVRQRIVGPHCLPLNFSATSCVVVVGGLR
jgi:hypothetical protein